MARMSDGRSRAVSRRMFLTGAAAVGATAVIGSPDRAGAEPPPETKKLRLVQAPILCLAPQFLAEDLLRMEGFSEVEYVKWSTGTGVMLVATGRADMTMWETPASIPLLDQRPSLVVLAGVHPGCIEIFGGKTVHTLRDLKGKTIAVSERGGTEHVFLSGTLAYVGIDPRKDVRWVETGSVEKTLQMFTAGESDAFFAFPPAPQELRAKKIGRVIVDTLRDRPWSQYFCCSIFGNRDFVTAHPVAAKRAMRAILKAADVCAGEPDRAARYMVAKGYESRPDIALEVVRALPFRKWREDNPEDTLRFYALRLHEVGMIKTTPNKLIAQCTDWRFLNELKRELKA